jgi:thiamine biosynthesis protein ThiS
MGQAENIFVNELILLIRVEEVDMQIVLNGDTLETADDCTVETLLQQLGISRERVAVELNADIVPKADYEKRLLSAGDKIEIVHFVGGG